MDNERKKLIEVSLPLDAINAASAREKSIRRGHPSTMHLWWARRPLAAARAVLFAQLVDDPSSRPELFTTEIAQDEERERLFRIIEEMVTWENTANQAVLDAARKEIRKSWGRICEDMRDHPRATELFNPDRLPAFCDPFAGGGAIPLEARLGLEAHASDLNPVAVLLNKATIEIPPKFADRSPVNPHVKAGELVDADWPGVSGIKEDVLYYGRWIRNEAKKHIGQLYPPIEVNTAMVNERPDLASYKGRKLNVIASLWARTVKSPNPAFSAAYVPLASTFMLSSKKGKEAYVEPEIKENSYRFKVKTGTPPDLAKTRRGTKSGGSRSNFYCLLSGVPITFEYLRAEAKDRRMDARLMAIVAEGDFGRVYISPTAEMEKFGQLAIPPDVAETDLPAKALGFRIQEYGMKKWRDLFTPRQLVSLSTFTGLVGEVRNRIRDDAVRAGVIDDGLPLRHGGVGATAYAEAVTLYLSLAVDRMASTLNTIALWSPTRGQTVTAFARQALPMTWDFPDVNPFAGAAGDYLVSVEGVVKAIVGPFGSHGFATQEDAVKQTISTDKLVSTDPPYYDNIGYADLSDFFYVWLRPSLRDSFPDLFATVTTPKTDELIASPFRHESKAETEEFFLDGMTRALRRLAEQTHPAFPITVYYAYKQSKSKSLGRQAGTGWETFLDAVIRSGLSITGTWPIRTERPTGMKVAVNALASSIVLVCRRRNPDATIASRRDFVEALKSELPYALAKMQEANLAPVDLAQAVIGPGMAVFTRYSRILDATGKPLSVGDALSAINQILDEVLAQQEGDFDADTRWALAWFEQSGFEKGRYGVAEALSIAKNNSVSGLVETGILESGGGTVRLLPPNQLPEDWDPLKRSRVTIWEATHHMVRVLDQGETVAAQMMAKLGSVAEIARELAYRLYRICDQKNRYQEALGYNALVQSWPEIARLARNAARSPRQITYLEENESVQ